MATEAAEKMDGALEDRRQVKELEERLRYAADGATARLKPPRIRPMIGTFYKLLRGTENAR
jgi:hypothetical protein